LEPRGRKRKKTGEILKKLGALHKNILKYIH
jgi:hypothetical protein